MGNEKSTTQGQTTQSQTQRPEPTAQEKEFNELALQRERASQEGRIESQTQGLNLINQLLTGQDLPGFLQQLPGGISSEAIGNQASQLARRFGAGFQGAGIAESGVAFRETARGIGSELLFPAEQFNLQNILQLLNLGVGGQAQNQSTFNQGSSVLGGQLAGLRTINQTGSGTSSQTTTGMNPFLKSFQQSAGNTLGSPSFKVGPFGF